MSIVLGLNCRTMQCTLTRNPDPNFQVYQPFQLLPDLLPVPRRAGDCGHYAELAITAMLVENLEAEKLMTSKRNLD